MIFIKKHALIVIVILFFLEMKLNIFLQILMNIILFIVQIVDG